MLLVSLPPAVAGLLFERGEGEDLGEGADESKIENAG